MKKTYLITGLVAIIAVVGFLLYRPAGKSSASSLKETLDGIPTPSGKTAFLAQSKQLTQKVDPELVDLDRQIITCQPTVDSLLTGHPSFGGSCTGGGGELQSIKGLYLSGQCCGVILDTKEIHENLRKLQAYRKIPGVPLYPFHTPVKTAKKWITYNNRMTLSSAQQTVYDKAVKISGEGPCCCNCWHYYVNEGVAKKMIKDYNYGAKQVSNFWEASDICGA